MSIKEDAREKIAQCFENCDNKTIVECGSYREKYGGEGCQYCAADQILALSGTTDIECPECGGQSKSYPYTCYTCNGDGVIKHKWKVSVTLENGELPDIGYGLIPAVTAKAYRDAGYVQEVRE